MRRLDNPRIRKARLVSAYLGCRQLYGRVWQDPSIVKRRWGGGGGGVIPPPPRPPPHPAKAREPIAIMVWSKRCLFMMCLISFPKR